MPPVAPVVSSQKPVEPPWKTRRSGPSNRAGPVTVTSTASLRNGRTLPAWSSARTITRTLSRPSARSVALSATTSSVVGTGSATMRRRATALPSMRPVNAASSHFMPHTPSSSLVKWRWSMTTGGCGRCGKFSRSGPTRFTSEPYFSSTSSQLVSTIKGSTPPMLRSPRAQKVTGFITTSSDGSHWLA
ncbi:hypothetical protein D9M72_537300 [compost metagenome]